MVSLVLEQAGPVATIVITNPAKRNAMTADMWRALPPLLDGLRDDPSVKVVVLAGAGGTFCAGADITEAALIARDGDDSLAARAELALADFPKPAIAKIEGFCVGGGCQLAVACDLRFATADSRFGVTPAKLGIVYPPSTTRRLAALVGPARAKLLLYTAELIDAPTALAFGLIDGLRDADEVAATIARRSQLTVHAAKAVLAGRAAPAQDEKELAEGIAAFSGRRAPDFGWAG
ncbi:enoyl-CoA hydratase/isomerase family protein [Dactylosporangium sucinum]|uniref:Enoyl-CoA hydratase n=1 Tax=Dactylosporangium sucinum TaxID=1424081 RepID=A0A917TA33_9ACTN|nr:enoyl-CoA hydratase/isomerase family protein [Dactylosporangium sucinum]GGM14761.1 enoyl-CoA hydratase [Dactylosporangium sucinum]